MFSLALLQCLVEAVHYMDHRIKPSYDQNFRHNLNPGKPTTAAILSAIDAEISSTP